MEDKIKEFIEPYMSIKLTEEYKNIIDAIMRDSIKFGSQLTAERAREKILVIENFESIGAYEEVLQAIEESIIK